MNDIIKDVIVNCLENLMINRIIEKDKKQLEVRMQEKQIKNDKLGNIYKELNSNYICLFDYLFISS